MWKLTIEDDEGKQTSLPLAHEEYGLGRADSNAIRLTDRNVSRTHALLKKNGQGWFLQDLSSYNGTYVNGTRVAGEQPVSSGDVVQLGDYRLELVDETVAAAAGEAPSATPAVAPIHQRPNRLVLVVGPTPGAEFPLDRDHFTIGRSEEATISINHSSVSRVHAEVIAIGGGRFEIVDKASANGIRINGVELKRGILEAGDALELGDVRLRFVGAGKIYKAFTDHSAHVHPAVQVPGFESVASVRAPAMQKSGGPSVGKLIGIGAVVGLLAILLFVLVTRAGGASPTPAQPSPASPQRQGTTTPADEKAVAEAKALADKKDFDGAHKRLGDIPETSPVRDESAFKDIENGWADATFAKVDASSDKVEKRKLLQQIAQATSVDPVRRKKALALVQAMDAAEPAPPDTAPGGAAAQNGGPVPGGASHAPAVEHGGPAPATAAAPTKVDSPPPTPGPAAADGTPDYDKQSQGLIRKCFGGNCSTGDLKMLKALCAAAGNRDCRDKATAMLKKKEAQ
jgi:pSer/pThr/pTyr-binding forkhead associated (FHA) protein/tetrahydromethanopterin S-methyltransferase subunit G